MSYRAHREKNSDEYNRVRRYRVDSSNADIFQVHCGVVIAYLSIDSRRDGQSIKTVIDRVPDFLTTLVTKLVHTLPTSAIPAH